MICPIQAGSGNNIVKSCHKTPYTTFILLVFTLFLFYAPRREQLHASQHRIIHTAEICIHYW